VRVLFGDSEITGLARTLVEDQDSAVISFVLRSPGKHGWMHLGRPVEARRRSCQAGMNERPVYGQPAFRKQDLPCIPNHDTCSLERAADVGLTHMHIRRSLSRLS